MIENLDCYFQNQNIDLTINYVIQYLTLFENMNC
jgi:hypothetical protein